MDHQGPRQRAWGALVPCVLIVVLIFVPGHAEAFTWPDLEGEWASVQVLLATASLPILGSITLHTVIGALTQITQSGSRLILQDRYCFTLATPSSWLFRTRIADQVMQSIVPPPRQVVLRIEGCDIRFEQSWHTEVRGAELDHAATDPLPTTPEDPRLVDLDQDGHPGMTIQASILGIMNGECYVVQRYRYRLEGTVWDENTIVGFVEWSSEQSVLDATHDLFMEPFTDDAHPDPSRHRFLMIRTDGAWTCETLKERLPEMLMLLDF